MMAGVIEAVLWVARAGAVVVAVFLTLNAVMSFASERHRIDERYRVASWIRAQVAVLAWLAALLLFRVDQLVTGA